MTLKLTVSYYTLQLGLVPTVHKDFRTTSNLLLSGLVSTGKLCKMQNLTYVISSFSYFTEW